VQFPLPAYDLLIARGRPRGARPAEWSRAEADVRELRRAAGDLAASHLRLGRHLDECAGAKRRLESEREVWRLLAVTEAIGDATRRVIQVVCACLNGDFGVGSRSRGEGDKRAEVARTLKLLPGCLGRCDPKRATHLRLAPLNLIASSTASANQRTRLCYYSAV
jgi:hypothetical protein